MTDFGRAKVEEAKQSGIGDAAEERQLFDEELLKQFDLMIKPYENAYVNYMKMSPSTRKTYAGSYFFGAKTEEGKKKRFDAIIERLNLNMNPMESMKNKLS